MTVNQFKNSVIGRIILAIILIYAHNVYHGFVVRLLEKG